MNVEIGLWPRNSFSVNICFKFSILVLCNVSPRTPNWCSIYTFFQNLLLLTSKKGDDINFYLLKLLTLTCSFILHYSKCEGKTVRSTS
jgi:hypothetical protein